MVLASTAALGAAYVAKYRKFVSGGRVDVYENEGKRSGAYQAGVYGVGPYLLLNHNDILYSLFTLAHEGGHAMHTVLSHETQPFVTSDYTIFVAEVASTTNERFLLNMLLETTTDPKERFQWRGTVQTRDRAGGGGPDGSRGGEYSLRQQPGKKSRGWLKFDAACMRRVVCGAMPPRLVLAPRKKGSIDVAAGSANGTLASLSAAPQFGSPRIASRATNPRPHMI